MNDELRLISDTVCVTEKALDRTEELPLERDIVLPDYYPDVFRILRCTAEPQLTSQSVSDGRLAFDITVTVRVLYLTEGSGRINCIEQNAEISRTLDIEGECSSPEVMIDLNCLRLSCRAKGSRRIDVRGTLCASVKVCCQREKTVVTGGSGCGIQLRKQTVTYPVKRLYASKRITVIQQTSLPDDKPSVGTVLRTGCSVTRTEQRIVAGKLAVKGEAELEALCTCIDKTGADRVQDLRFTLPFSRMIDMEGLDDSYRVSVRVKPSGCSITAGGGEDNTVEWELELDVFCTAEKSGAGVGVTDAYSTEYDCLPDEIVEISSDSGDEKHISCISECTLAAPDGTVGAVYDHYASCTRPTIRKDGNTFRISGGVTCSVMGEGSEGGIFCIEGQSTYEAEAAVPEESSESTLEAYAETAGCSYYLGDGGTIRVRTDVRVVYKLNGGSGTKLVSSVILNKDKPATRDSSCTLRLCRCGENEDIWDIAKRCRTTVEAVREDNGLPDGADSIDDGRMIVIRG
ncbi:DUF3794 domain-containing protein [Ruminococcus albus]|uniref:SipL SPOCS domain-containing protein n=1 Tax=Ruminococcus albus (strain ATCC 27210 / DSM 20455 / JCM 14654 / NCDO 2250 / 7) TaxID=697329 RepID=E6UGM0_RUMA7|nr:DUF3794 domain-containing protein [Ruminococcus albus]ADU23143.1 hypothetical protein Rumal_2668 [Ruminococcus albus 7 = DSM 20455]